ncbi:hypothetical protein M422DRAFT_39610 [Sphaerobolus stellatus SS14]|uniref:Major facilitator superfamily (MFS) profile domain-containing protein n=1 Tax=Sphaerobolus stellatus (strain SS14) TaxID=990650 RepID=A0A0C9T3J3_SPHS4|nr:hypothetical protein M422DRAFT_39610 [Sphaerobolus stellatus SS14]
MATHTTTTTEPENIALSSIRLKSLRNVSKASVTESVHQILENDRNTAAISVGSATSQVDPVADPINDKEIRRRGHIQFAALCFCLFLAGWNDGTTGPLLPRIQNNYHVNFTIVSLLFVCACLGFILGAFSNVFLTDRFGFGKTIVIGGVAQIIGYAMMAPAPPFPVLVIGFVINGFGIALQDAQANGFVAASEDRALMNFLHAAYGVGATCAPIVATQFAQLPRWSFHYLTSLGLSIANLIILAMVFKFRTQEELLEKNGHPPVETNNSQHSTMRQILTTPSVHLLAFFILVYVGIEVTIGGWIVTFIIDKRGGGSHSGYISTGFFAGLTAGRIVLHYLTRFIAEQHTIFLYSFLCIGLEITIWLVPSLIENAVSVSFIGFLLGPLYPAIMNQARNVIPRWLLTGSIGWISGFGQAGSALLPFITGALANKFGINSLQPLIIAAIALMIGLWVLVVPRARRRLD